MWKIGNKSISVAIGLRTYMHYGDQLELIKFAERAGFDRFFCSNEKFFRDMWVTLGLVAGNMKKAEIGTFIADPYSYHPALIAAAIATLDEATQGRAILILGAGGAGFREMGIKRVKPLTALEESIHLIRGLLTGQAVTLDGQVISAHEAQLRFKARSSIPIWVASRGNKVLEMAGRVADGVMVATYAQPKGIQEGLSHVLKGVNAVGRNPETLTITVRVDMSIDPIGENARVAVKPMIAGMIKASYPDTSFVEQTGLSVPTEMASLLASVSYEEAKARAAKMVSNEFVDAFSWAGTPEDVAKKIAAVINAGYSNICIVPHASIDQGVLDVVRSFTTDVVPRITAQFR